MTPPTCIADGCANPVKRSGSAKRCKRGFRVDDGVRWCWFCSLTCAARTTGYGNHGQAERLVNAAKALRRKRLQSEIARLRDVCGQQVDAHGVVHMSLKELVKLILIEKLKAYNAGNAAAHYWQRKGGYKQREAA